MKDSENEFFLRKRLRAFGYAISGIMQSLKSETHLKIHFVSAVVVIILGFYFSISNAEWLAVMICIALVISLEMVNSSIESLCNVIHPQQDQTIRYVKDVMAAAVLIASIFAFIVGLIVFWPYLFH